jgi:hypothetical protein
MGSFEEWVARLGSNLIRTATDSNPSCAKSQTHFRAL